MRIQHLAIAAVSLAAVVSPLVSQGQTRFFRQVSSYGVTGGIAEIVAASPDGNTLAFSDADGGRVGFVNISDAANPQALPDVITGGEPTSVSWAGDYVVAAVLTAPWSEGQPAPDPTDPANAGALYVIDASDTTNPTVLGTVPIGFQPDSCKVVERGGVLVAVVCIENEPIVVDMSELVLDEDRPGFPTSGSTFPQDRSLPGLVQVVTIDTTSPSNSTVIDVPLPESTLAAAGLLYPMDPQPEFVDVYGGTDFVDGYTAAVSLQENNGIAVIDITDTLAPTLLRVFSTGNATERLGDLTEDDAISFVEGYPSAIGGSKAAPLDGGGNPVLGGPRMPDAIAFSPDGSTIFSADEGELNYTGGRGFSAFGIDGSLTFEDGGSLEQIGVIFGQYPEGRSENRGIEVEGITTARFGRTDFAFVLSERGSFMAVYDISNPAAPSFVQFLPTGISPEGVAAIPVRNLVVTADEESGTLSIFQGVSRFPRDADRPLLFSLQSPFGAISGLDDSPFSPFGVVGVPDNALPTSIFQITLGSPTGLAPLINLIPVTVSGAQARYDGEGIVRDQSILAPSLFPGFFLASEGNGSDRPNLIVHVDVSGRVLAEIQMPSNIDAAADPALGGTAVGSALGGTIRGNGFEGVTLSPDGRYLFACVQRQFNGEPDTHTRIARYDLEQIRSGSAPSSGLRYGGDWEFFYYPLEAATGAGWIGLSEIRAIGDDQFIVIERDQGIGSETQLKSVYAFSIAGLVADTDGQPGEPMGNDTATKMLAIDVQGEFFPFEKVEGLAIIGGDLWVALDNDGGELANRFVNTGPFQSPLSGR